MTPEEVKLALTELAEETAKAAVKRSLTITMMGPPPPSQASQPAYQQPTPPRP